MSTLRPEDEPATLVGLLDGLIDQGVHVAGDLSIGLANVALIRVALRLLVASEETAQRTGVRHDPAPGPTDRARSKPSPPPPSAEPAAPPPRPSPPSRPAPAPRPVGRRPSAVSGEPGRSVEAADREQLVRGVSQLVLTVVEVIRELLERQAIRRVDAGTLTDDQVERLGIALQALEERMDEVKQIFGVDDEDLNLDLGRGTFR